MGAGRDEFVRQLRELGREPEEHEGEWISLAHRIERGTYGGVDVRVAFDVPLDFPTTPPSGPHVSPRLRPNSDVDRHPDRVADSPRGNGWMYLSRPFLGPGLMWTAKRGVRGYLAFVTSLLETL
jgi:hypothetical protein